MSSNKRFKKQQDKEKFSIKILGEEQLIVADVSEDYVEELADYINSVGTEIIRAYPSLPRRRLLGLTMINMADEFYKLREEYYDKNDKIKELKSKNYDLKEKVEELKEKLQEKEKENEELLTLLEEVD
ncbi:MAG: cell division protein ZapA [Bacillota bacterium]